MWTGTLMLARRRFAVEWHLVILNAAFFLSGFSALIYQVAWQRLLSFFSGTDAVATTLVVAAFLLGLGIGSLVSAAFADRLSKVIALRAFALCELGIAIFALASSVLFSGTAFGELSALARDPALALAVVFLFLLTPTLLMGMSLPLLSRAVVRTIDTAYSHVGWLYGANTLGASCGALFGGFYLIGTFGFVATVYMAVVLNVCIAGLAVSVASLLRIARGEDVGPPMRPDTHRVGHGIWFWSAVVFISGFLVISLEMLWFRALGLTMQSNTYAFPAILSVFLLGDAAGIVYAAGSAYRLREPEKFFLLLQGLAVLYALLAFVALWFSVGWYDLSRLSGGGFSHHPAAMKLGYYFFCSGFTVLCVFPPTFLCGMSFPITQRALQDDLGLVAWRVGLIQLFNILGNTAGALVTGLVLLQLLGTSGTIRAVGVAALALIVTLVLDSSGRRVPGRTWFPAANRPGAVVLAVLLSFGIIAFPANTSFWSRFHGVTSVEAAIVAEDRTGVAVLRRVSSEPRQRGEAGTEEDFLYIGGHTQSSVPFSTVHGALGVVGPILHPNPRSILVIGNGAGGTPYGAGLNPATRRIRVVEIVEPVFSVMRRFAAASRNATLAELYVDNRYDDVVADARHVLFTDEGRYDVIESDAIYPHSAHAGLLYSVEFFQQVRERLNDGGIYVQWAATERTLASFLAVFPYVVRLNDVLLGSDRPIAYSKERLAAGLIGQAHDYLVAAQWDPEAILNRLTEKSEQIWIPSDPRTDGDVNSDLFPKDEYFLNQSRRPLL